MGVHHSFPPHLHTPSLFLPLTCTPPHSFTLSPPHLHTPHPFTLSPPHLHTPSPIHSFSLSPAHPSPIHSFSPSPAHQLKSDTIPKVKKRSSWYSHRLPSWCHHLPIHPTHPLNHSHQPSLLLTPHLHITAVVISFCSGREEKGRGGARRLGVRDQVGVGR